MLLTSSFPHAGNFLESLLRGFSWSIGWMLARQLGLPAAAAALVLVLAYLWFRRRRATRRRERAQDGVGVYSSGYGTHRVDNGSRKGPGGENDRP